MTHSELTRKSSQRESQMIPRPIPGESHLLQVDSTWGKIQPMQVAEGVRTVGELEVIEHIKSGHPVIDGRKPEFYRKSTLPSARNLPYTEIKERIDDLDRRQVAVFFCNGPQCTQSPMAIRTLLEQGYPPEKILYYRGGMHDWLTLGLPVETGGEQEVTG